MNIQYRINLHNTQYVMETAPLSMIIHLSRCKLTSRSQLVVL